MNTRISYGKFASSDSVILGIILIIVIFIKVSPWLCLFFASFTVIISGQLLWFSGIIVDELNLRGNSTDFFLFLGLKSLKKEKYRTTL